MTQKLGWILFLAGFFLADIFALHIPAMKKIDPMNAYFLVILLAEGIIILGLFDKLKAGFADREKVDHLKRKSRLKLAAGALIGMIAGGILVTGLEMVTWNWFFPGVAMALAGAGILGRPKPLGHPLNVDLKHIELIGWLENLIKEVDGIKFSRMPKPAIKGAIEKIELERLVPFSENRHHFAQEYGLTRFAEFFSLFSVGEMYVNRAWSSLVDDDLSESENSLIRAREYFVQAHQVIHE